MQPYLIGLGLYQGWLWFFFLSGPLLHMLLARWNGPAEYTSLLFIFCHSLALLIIAKQSTVLSFLKQRRPVLVASALAMSAAPLLMSVVSAGYGVSIRYLVIALVALSSGVGAACLVVAWGERFSAVSIKDASLAFAGSVTLGTVIFFAQVYLGITVAAAITAILPLLSLLMLLVDNPVILETPRNNSEAQRRFPFPSRFTLLMVMYYLVGGLMYKAIYIRGTLPQEMYWLTNVVYWVVCLAVGIAIYKNSNFDLRFLYRPALPLLGIGFLLYPLASKLWYIAPFSFLQAGFAVFDTYMWLLFAYFAARDSDPVRVFGWGLFTITASIFTGEFVFTFLLSTFSLQEAQADVLSVGGAVVMLGATLVFQENRETFAGWVGAPLVEEALDEAVTPVMPGATQTVEGYLLSRNLTAREREVVLLLIQGRNNPFIREHLNISNNTLKTHLRNIYQKLSVSDRQELISRLATLT